MREDGLARGFILGQTPGAERILLYDDLEGIFKWSYFGVLGEGSCRRNPFIAYNGDACMQLATRARLAAPGDKVAAYRYIPNFGRTRYMVDVIWRFCGFGCTASVDFEFWLHIPIYAYYFFFKYNVVLAKWLYYSSTGLWLDVPGGGQSLAAEGWHRVTFCFDALKVKYISLVSDGDSFNMSTVDGFRAHTSGGESAQMRFTVVAGAAPPAYSFFDDILVMRV